jgi:hypothetical protein
VIHVQDHAARSSRVRTAGCRAGSDVHAGPWSSRPRRRDATAGEGRGRPACRRRGHRRAGRAAAPATR